MKTLNLIFAILTAVITSSCNLATAPGQDQPGQGKDRFEDFPVYNPAEFTGYVVSKIEGNGAVPLWFSVAEAYYRTPGVVTGSVQFISMDIQQDAAEISRDGNWDPYANPFRVTFIRDTYNGALHNMVTSAEIYSQRKQRWMTLGDFICEFINGANCKTAGKKAETETNSATTLSLEGVNDTIIVLDTKIIEMEEAKIKFDAAIKAKKSFY